VSSQALPSASKPHESPQEAVRPHRTGPGSGRDSGPRGRTSPSGIPTRPALSLCGSSQWPTLIPRAFCYVQLKGQVRRRLAAAYPHFEYPRRSSAKKDVSTWFALEGRRQLAWDRGNESCPLVERPHHAGSEVLARRHPVPRIRPETGTEVGRRSSGASREGRGISQTEMAAALKVDPSTWRNGNERTESDGAVSRQGRPTIESLTTHDGA